MEIQRVRTEAPVVQLTATFAAPRHQVFAAWTQQGPFRRWFMTEGGFSTSNVELDPRPLGPLRVTVEVPDGQGPTRIAGHFIEVVKNQTLRCTWSGTTGEDLTLLVLKLESAEEGGCRMHLTHGVFGSDEDREVHEQAWTTNLAALDRLLTS